LLQFLQVAVTANVFAADENIWHGPLTGRGQQFHLNEGAVLVVLHIINVYNIESPTTGGIIITDRLTVVILAQNLTSASTVLLGKKTEEKSEREERGTRLLVSLVMLRKRTTRTGQ
jgi:hypothetical protein